MPGEARTWLSTGLRFVEECSFCSAQPVSQSGEENNRKAIQLEQRSDRNAGETDSINNLEWAC